MPLHGAVLKRVCCLGRLSCSHTRPRLLIRVTRIKQGMLLRLWLLYGDFVFTAKAVEWDPLSRPTPLSKIVIKNNEVTWSHCKEPLSSVA